ncbi:MAG: HAMP domain-containing protein [Bacillota bacterium]
MDNQNQRLPLVKWKQRMSLQTKIAIAFVFTCLYLMLMMLMIFNFFAQSLVPSEILSSLFRRVAPLFVTAGLMGIIISQLIVIKLVKKPVKELIDATERVSLGDLTKPASMYYKDELGWLANCFNKMTSHLSYLVKTAQEYAKYMLRRSEQNYDQVVIMEKHYLHIKAQVEALKGLVSTHKESIYSQQEDLAKVIKEDVAGNLWLELKDGNVESKKLLDRVSTQLQEAIEEIEETKNTVMGGAEVFQLWDKHKEKWKATINSMAKLTEKNNLLALTVSMEKQAESSPERRQLLAADLYQATEETAKAVNEMNEILATFDGQLHKYFAELVERTTQGPETLERLSLVIKIVTALDDTYANCSSVLFRFRETLGIWWNTIQQIEAGQAEQTKELAATFTQLIDLEKLLDEEYMRFRDVKTQLGKLVRTASNMEIHLAQFKA